MTDTAIRTGALPIGAIGRKAFGWWGMLTIIMTEGALFGYMLFSYYYFAVQYGREFLPDQLPEFKLSLPNTIILLLSSVSVWWGERAIRQNSTARTAIAVGISLVLGVVFMTIQGFEWLEKPFTLASSTYGSLYFTITGFHVAHVFAGTIMLAVLLVWVLLGNFDSRRHAAISVGSLYWHFVDIVWLTLFFTFYITPRLG
jgi:heme/copper-type cytochrome/quinol oxidase subunit 3